jgi:L-asparaginase II
MNEAPVAIEVVRGSTVESRHRAIISAVDSGGHRLVSFGDTATVTYLRSAAKPFQALPLVASGAARHFQFERRELAVICGSHSGEPIHTETVSAILQKIGLSVEALACGLHPPFDPATANRVGETGITALHNNCSGKHAGMLALAQFRRQDVSTYLDPAHPVQQEILATIARYAGMKTEEIAIGIDGCGAPTFAVPVERMALMYARLVNPDAGLREEAEREAAREIVQAMTEHPEMVGGTHRRLDTVLIAQAPQRWIAKVGAEGIFTLGVFPSLRYPDGLGIAVKIEDGDDRRARNIVVVEVLDQLGLLTPSLRDALSCYRHARLTNHRGEVVGTIRPAFQLTMAL